MKHGICAISVWDKHIFFLIYYKRNEVTLAEVCERYVLRIKKEHATVQITFA